MRSGDVRDEHPRYREQVLRILLTPRWLALHVAVVLVVIGFGLFGWWQLDSYRSAQVTPAPATTAAPVPLSSVMSPGRPLTADAVRRVVTVSGRYDAEQQQLVPGRELDGRTGLLVVTPLLTDDGSALPVHRGWVAAADAPETQVPSGTVTVTGTLQPSEGESSARVDPAGPVRAGELPFIATPQLMLRLPYSPSDLYEGYLLLADQDPLAAPAPRPVKAPAAVAGGVSPLRNLSYAAQWWIFAAAAIFFWGAFVRRALTDRRTAPASTSSRETQPVR